MRVLIFGANGYIGQRTVQRLVAEGHEVTGYVRSETAAATVRALGAGAVIASLDDQAAVRDTMLAHDAAIWLAQLTLPEEKRVVGEYLRMLKNTGKTFIFTGGTSVLSQLTKGEWADITFAETDSIIPRAPLAIRAETEYVVRTAAQFGVRSIVARPPLVYGHGGCKVISDLYHSARSTGAACYVGRGLNAYTTVHIDDLTQLFSLALARGRAGALYHCVGSEASFRGMAEAVARALGVGTRSVTLEEAQEIWGKFSATVTFGSSSRSRSPLARAELGWAPEPGRPDVLEECANPAYAAESERSLASWVNPTGAAG
jgi:nucleoside-diphosphate-sugar epimerase